MSIVLLKLNC